MNTINVSKSNKMIAKFMEGKFGPCSRLKLSSNDVWLPVHGVCRFDTIDLGKGKTLCYHKSWDWLIPVINKIKSHDSYSKYVDHTTSIIDQGGVYINTKFIDVTYDNVIDFINWFNLNN